MNHYLLRRPDRVCGFTDLFVVTHADMTTTADNTDQTITLDALAFGDIVAEDACLEIVTAFTGGSADNACTASLGVTGAVTQFIGASAFYAGGTPTAVGTGYVTAETGSPYFTPTGGKNLLLTLDITDADGDMEDYTAGELHIWLNISRKADRKAVT